MFSLTAGSSSAVLPPVPTAPTAAQLAAVISTPARDGEGPESGPGGTGAGRRPTGSPGHHTRQPGEPGREAGQHPVQTGEQPVRQPAQPEVPLASPTARPEWSTDPVAGSPRTSRDTGQLQVSGEISHV